MWIRFSPIILISLLLLALGIATLSPKERGDPFTSPLLNKAFPEAPNLGVTSKIFNPEKVSVVNYFASWCIPCHIEHSNLEQIRKHKNIQLIGIAFKDTPEKIEAYLNKLGDPYDIVLQDPEGLLALNLGIHGVPETFIIDKDNIIRFNHAGPVMANDITKISQIIERYK